MLRPASATKTTHYYVSFLSQDVFLFPSQGSMLFDASISPPNRTVILLWTYNWRGTKNGAGRLNAAFTMKMDKMANPTTPNRVIPLSWNEALISHQTLTGPSQHFLSFCLQLLCSRLSPVFGLMIQLGLKPGLCSVLTETDWRTAIIRHRKGSPSSYTATDESSHIF